MVRKYSGILQQGPEDLNNHKSIVIPKPSDHLWIVTDGSTKEYGLGATLYITREGQTRLAGFFSAKLRARQVNWIPCEIEALAIAVAIKHFSPYIIQSQHNTIILTDSKPCVQAYEKLHRGEFSASPRVLTFLSNASRYQTTIRHISGAANIQSDFSSRNASACNEMGCQICSFVKQTEDATVRQIDLQDIIQGNVRLPFTSRNAWLCVQQECSDMRRTHAHLRQGTRPSKKLTNIRDVKRYLRVASISKDGLLVVRRHQPLLPTQDCIIVPRQFLDGLLTALHIQLNHPTRNQMKLVFHRYFYALDSDKAIDNTSNTCHQCASLAKISPTIKPQESCPPPEAIGTTFAADVIKRNRQLIFVLRETVTSYTTTMLIESERHDSLREALIRLCVGLRPLDGPPAVIRTDPAPGFQALVSDKLLAKERIILELGRIKNPNKNPVAEKAVQELEEELLRHDPLNSSISAMTLSIVTARLNSRIRSRGLSAREMWTHRDQFTHEQIPVDDKQLIIEQQTIRENNHEHSERSKTPSNSRPHTPNLSVGDIVYLSHERHKTHNRPRYLVTHVDGTWVNVAKFIGSQLRSTTYRVRSNECFKVPSSVVTKEDESNTPSEKVVEDDHDEDGYLPPFLPVIPRQPVTSDYQTCQMKHHTMIPDDKPTETLDLCDVPSNPIPLDSVETYHRPTRIRTKPKYLDDYETEF